MIYSVCSEVKYLSRLAFFLLVLPFFLFAAGEEENPKLISKTEGSFASRDSISILAVGDLMLAGTMESTLRQNGSDYPFDSVRTVLQKADIAFANLEAPFATSGVRRKKQYTFRMQPHVISGIQNAGFDLCTLANNHILDFGREGLASTLQVLDSAGVVHCGAGMNREEAEMPRIITCKGIRVAFLAFSLTYPEEFWATSSRCGTAYPHQSTLEKIIPNLKQEVDVVVISFHWGGERLENPKSYQRNYAHRAIDLGADVVIGHHPHVIQGVEIYKNKFIAYSLGNFAFGSTNPCYKEGMMAEIWLDKKGLRSVQIIPIDVDNTRSRFQPLLIRGAKESKVIEYINSISKFHANTQPPVLPSGQILFH